MHKAETDVGSNRRASINLILAKALAKRGSERFDFSFARIGDLPMYNQDLEGNRPPEVTRFTSEIVAAEAVLFVTPEHNRSIPAVLKNAIDWGSKPRDNNVWRDKIVAITGTSAGAISSAVGQQHLRQIMGAVGSLVLGREAYIRFQPGLVDDANDITDPLVQPFVDAFLADFAALTDRMIPRR